MRGHQYLKSRWATQEGKSKQEEEMPSRKVLFVKPKGFSVDLCALLPVADWEVHVASSLGAASRLAGEQHFLVGFVLVTTPDVRSCAEIAEFLHSHPNIEWVGGFDAPALQVQECRDLIFERMFDHLTMPVDAQRLAATLGHAYGHATLRRNPAHAEAAENDSPIIGRTSEIQRLMRQVKRIAKVDAPALICGESGSGKELVAQAIHNASQRALSPFVVVNCGAIPAALIQSELFGHEKGSFTGADRQRQGLIEAANGGTIFLDEIGDLPLDMQTNLLRFLQEGTIDRVGSTKTIRVDVRVIAATHVELEAAVASGAFRKDLYYRLNVLPLSVPPLRERADDILLLAQHFFDKYASDRGSRLKGFSQRALVAMTNHDWPGNVRELINRIRRAMVLAEGKWILPADLGLEQLGEKPSRVPLDEARMNAERHAISETLQSAGKNVSFAAKQLQISRMTLYRLMAKHRISA
jgi:DNA-binding NtrC family response regulator